MIDKLWKQYQYELIVQSKRIDEKDIEGAMKSAKKAEEIVNLIYKHHEKIRNNKRQRGN